MIECTLTVIVSDKGTSHADHQIESICRKYLDNLSKQKTSETVFINQELMFYMFRALLYEEYSHLRHRVRFFNSNANDEILFDSRMRVTSNNHPFDNSIYTNCLCLLLQPQTT